jgi:hypothetical protein
VVQFAFRLEPVTHLTLGLPAALQIDFVGSAPDFLGAQRIRGSFFMTLAKNVAGHLRSNVGVADNTSRALYFVSRNHVFDQRGHSSGYATFAVSKAPNTVLVRASRLLALPIQH